MAAATAPRQYLLHVIPEKEPDLFRERHINTEIGQKHTYAGVPMRVVVVMHDYSRLQSLRNHKTSSKERGNGIGDEALPSTGTSHAFFAQVDTCWNRVT